MKNDCFLVVKSCLTEPCQGHIKLLFQSEQEKTILRRSYAHAPLKIQRPFYPEPNICHTVVLHSAGGMVDGEELDTIAELNRIFTHINAMVIAHGRSRRTRSTVIHSC
jgi:urease accessory protein